MKVIVVRAASVCQHRCGLLFYLADFAALCKKKQREYKETNNVKRALKIMKWTV
jgi:HD-like signal output (HDOD) protein